MREVSEQHGAIHMAAGLCTPVFALLKQFVVHGTADVFGGRPVIGSGHRTHGYNYADADNRGGARKAVRYLVSQDQRHI